MLKRKSLQRKSLQLPEFEVEPEAKRKSLQVQELEVKPQTDFSETPLSQQIARDAHLMKDYLDRGEEGQQKSPNQNILARTMLLMTEQGDVKFRNDNNDAFQSMSDKNAQLNPNEQFNYAALLGHGGRVYVTMETPEEAEKILSWLLTGSPDGKVKMLSHDKAFNEGLGYYKRMFASHGIDKDGNEIKLGFLNKPFSMISSDSGRHIGVDLGYKGPDGEGPEDGSHAHLYIHFDPGKPPDKKPGLLIGVENSAPLKKDVHGGKHTADSKAKKVSATGGAKSKDFPKDYPIRPTDIDGKRIELTSQSANALIKKDASEFDSDILKEPVSKNKPEKVLKKEANVSDVPTGKASKSEVLMGEASTSEVLTRKASTAEVSTRESSKSEVLMGEASTSEGPTRKASTSEGLTRKASTSIINKGLARSVDSRKAPPSVDYGKQEKLRQQLGSTPPVNIGDQKDSLKQQPGWESKQRSNSTADSDSMKGDNTKRKSLTIGSRKSVTVETPPSQTVFSQTTDRKSSTASEEKPTPPTNKTEIVEEPKWKPAKFGGGT